MVVTEPLAKLGFGWKPLRKAPIAALSPHSPNRFRNAFQTIPRIARRLRPKTAVRMAGINVLSMRNSKFEKRMDL